MTETIEVMDCCMCGETYELCDGVLDSGEDVGGPVFFCNDCREYTFWRPGVPDDSGDSK